MQAPSSFKEFLSLVLALALCLNPLVRSTQASPQRTGSRGDINKDDPCTHLPDPRGNANGIARQCPAGGSSSGIAKGDFNGDGYADLAVGEPGASIGGQTAAGDVFIIYGSPNGLTATHQLWYTSGIPGAGAPAANDLFGSALASGDFNNDGYSDLAIGVPGKNVVYQGKTYQDWGEVIILYGSPDGLTVSAPGAPSPTVLNLGQNFFHRDGDAAPGARLGSSLAWGDFNGDGTGDLAIGAPHYALADEPLFTPQKPEAGAVWVISGVAKGSTGLGGLNPFHTISDLGVLFMEDDLGNFPAVGTCASCSYDHFGAVLAAGDFDADKRSDLAIGVPDKQLQSTVFPFDVFATSGTVVVLLGGAAGLNLSVAFGGDANLDEPGLQSGAALAVGDFDGNGFADLAIGGPGEIAPGKLCPSGCNTGGSVGVFFNSGTAFFKNVTHLDQTGFSSGSLQPGARFGAALAAGDFNGDGKVDLAVGVPLKNVTITANGLSETFTAAGEVDVIYLGVPVNPGALPPSQQWNQDNAFGKKTAIAANSRFGAPLTAWNFGLDESGTLLGHPIVYRTADLAIGVPNKTVAGVSGAGEVDVMYGSFYSNGLTGNTPKGTVNAVFTSATLGEPPLAGYHFGAGLY